MFDRPALANAKRSTAALLGWVCLLATAAASAGEARPFYTGLRPPKILFIGQGPQDEETAERWRVTAPADVTFLQLFYVDQTFHHLCDKPLEEKKEEIDAVVASGAANRKLVLDRLADFDVVVTHLPATSPQPDRQEVLREVQARVTARVRAGGKLVVIGEPFPDTSPSGVMPCRLSPSRRNWTYGSEGATDHPFVRGLPLEVTGAHWYGTLCETGDFSSIPLTRNVRDRQNFWLRALPGGGQVVYLFDLGGATWLWRQGTNDRQYAPDRPDDGLVWNAFASRLFYGLTYGDRAFPVLARIAVPEGTRARSGQPLAIPVDLENRSAVAQSVAVAVTVAERRSPGAATAVQSVSLVKGERRTVTLQVTPAFPCADNQLAISARVLDATGAQVLSESLAWIPFQHTVPLAVTTARPSYRPGERIAVKVDTGTATPASDAALNVYLVDHDGRIVEHGDARGELVMPDGGPELLSSYWVTAQLSGHGDVLGTARAQVQVDRPWSMRDQVQWSVWTQTSSVRQLDLMRDAGFNTLGMTGNNAVADRFGLRQYVEGTGIDTFGVTIDHESWAEVRAAMERQVAKSEADSGPDSRSKSLVSLGEESGFKGGWGTRYYWKEDHAPPLVQRVFDTYLADRYHGSIVRLNAEWGSRYGAFSDVPLQRGNVRPSDQVITAAQIDLSQPYVARTAPVYESNLFFDWYYDKYTQLAMTTYRAGRNPVPLSIMSAPGSLYPKVDVFNFRGMDVFHQKESLLVANAVARRSYGDTPGFGLFWGYFDLHPLWSATVLSTLLAGNNHLDYWVDVPLTFNPDLTHTRASFWNKVLTRQLRPIEPILLHRRIAYTRGLGMFIPAQPFPSGVVAAQFRNSADLNGPTYAALEESGYLPQVVDADHLGPLTTLVASFAQVVSPAEGKKIAAFVKRGGLLIATPWLASCSPHGNVLSTYPEPSTGLAALLGFRLRNTSQVVKHEDVATRDFQLSSNGRDQVLDLARDVEVVARYADGTPLLLQRRVGRGRVVYLNDVYDWHDWWNSFQSAGREGYRRLMDSVIAQVGAQRSGLFRGVRIGPGGQRQPRLGDVAVRSQPRPGESVPWWATQLYTDPSGRIQYLAIFADHRSPKVTARVKFKNATVSVFDLMNGQSVPVQDGASALTLRPGEAAFWAISKQSPTGVELEVPARVAAGDPIPVKVTVPDGAGLVVDVFDPSGRPSRAHSLSHVALRDGRSSVEIPTAENDLPGVYRVVATESMTRLRAEKTFTLLRTREVPAREALTPFPPRTSDAWPNPTMTSDEFLRQLRLLRAVYLGQHRGFEAKYMLSYFLHVPFRPDNRHAILRRLQRVEWMPHLSAVAEALRAGETFYLTGEDLGADPETGLRIDPFARGDEDQFLAAIAQLPGAQRVTTVVDGLPVEAIQLGKGALVLCRKASVDRAAYLSRDFAAWQDTLKHALTAVRRHDVAR